VSASSESPSVRSTSSVARWLTVIVVAVACIALGPWIGYVRAWMRDAFPGRFGAIVNSLVAVLVLTASLAAIVRIREARKRRYVYLALALGVALVSARMTATASANQNAVERFHFIEYGVVTWLCYRAALREALGRATKPIVDASVLIVPVLMATMAGTVDEWFQWFVPERVGEWRDVLLNFSAIGAGILFSLGVEPPVAFSRTWFPGSRRRIALAALAAWLVIAAFVTTVHLGTMVDDEKAGRFRSRYDAAQLGALAADRTARWRVEPPPATPPRFSREDQYLSEGLWHVQARNKAWEADIGRAWLENRILEAYFDPVLDVRTNVVPVSRWPAEQRRDAESRAAQLGAIPSESRAEPLPIYAWPRSIYWSVVGLIAGILFWIARRGDRGPSL